MLATTIATWAAARSFFPRAAAPDVGWSDVSTIEGGVEGREGCVEAVREDERDPERDGAHDDAREGVRDPTSEPGLLAEA